MSGSSHANYTLRPRFSVQFFHVGLTPARQLVDFDGCVGFAEQQNCFESVVKVRCRGRVHYMTVVAPKRNKRIGPLATTEHSAFNCFKDQA